MRNGRFVLLFFSFCLLADCRFGNAWLFQLAARGRWEEMGLGGFVGGPDIPCCLRNRLAPRLSSLSLCLCVSLKGSRGPSALCKGDKSRPTAFTSLRLLCVGVWGSGGQGTLVPALPLRLVPTLAQSPPLAASSALAEKWGLG